MGAGTADECSLGTQGCIELNLKAPKVLEKDETVEALEQMILLDDFFGKKWLFLGKVIVVEGSLLTFSYK